jgi:hypothetical protein
MRSALALAGPALALVCVLLSGCLLPDRFDATLSVGAESATLDYAGELVAVSAEDEATTRKALDEVAEDVRKDGGTVEYAVLAKGRARATVHWTQATPAVGAKTSFADLVAIRRQADGALEIVTPALKDRDRAQLTKMGLGDAAGRLCVKTAGMVVESNARTAPDQPGGCHGWTITVLKDEPVRMLVRF